MIKRVPSETEFRGDPLLPVAELLHRVENEYARVISLASVMAANSSIEETKLALRDITSLLHTTAEIYRVLRPPTVQGVTDLTEVLTRLCRAMAASSQFRHCEIGLELRVDKPILIDASRCWLLSLVVAELITNSYRHAFVSSSGCIRVTAGESRNRVFCEVSDDGSPAEMVRTGFGTQLINAIGTELKGMVERRFGNSGATVTISFPKPPPTIVVKDYEYPG